MRMPIDKRGKPRTSLTVATENFTFERTKAVVTRRRQDELLVARGRGELILETLVEKQATYLEAAMRQKILSMPLSFAGRILNLSDPAQAHKILKELSISLLNELRDLPKKVTDPHWLETLEDHGEAKRSPSSNTV